MKKSKGFVEAIEKWAAVDGLLVESPRIVVVGRLPTFLQACPKADMMKRTARVYLNSLNNGKANVVRHFLDQCHDVTQYFVDLFWQREDYSGKLAD